MALSTAATSSASLAPTEASAHRWSYEVFLSFRGADTRKGITSAIYDALNMRGIKTFIDDEKIQVGDSISPILLTAIKESRFAIVVLSENYAGSTWCLKELTEIVRCMKEQNRILPLFYNLEPSYVRHLKGSFKAAFEKHESRLDKEKVKQIEEANQWKDALRDVALLSGWVSDGSDKDVELVEHIVRLVWSKVLQVRIETSRDFEAFVATKLAIDKVMEALRDDQVSVIGLYGIRGVGKTTLVKHAGDHARANKLFDTVIMAELSQSLDLKKIQDQLADMLALNLGEHTEEEGRALKLKEAIFGAKKVLVVLDGMGKKVPLWSIGISDKEELQKYNCKVLFTARTEKVCQEMQSDAKINLSTLSEEDSLKLFLKKANMTFHETTKIYSVANEVARKYAGLPIALVAAARAFQDEDVEKWKEAAERQLHRSQPTNPENENHVFNYMKSCYDYLSTDAKSCLLFCCLFPKDYDIPTEDLFMYGIGKGLFEESKTLQEARAAADLVFVSLKASNLLLDTKKKGCVRVNDVIRDVVMSIASIEDDQYMLVKSGQDLTEWPKTEAYNDYSAISLMNTQIRKLPEQLVCSKLVEILSLNKSPIKNLPERFFQSQSELRVLDLRLADDTVLSKLPKTFSLLSNLRALLINCRFSNLSDLGKLEKLEILILTCFNVDFPKELGHLSKLRMLDISNQSYHMFPPQVISRLVNLEELYMKGVFFSGRKGKKEKEGNQTDLCCDEFIGLPHLNVVKFHIYKAGGLPKVVEFDPQWVKFDVTINANADVAYLAKLPQHENKNSLCLDTTINDLPDWFKKAVTERTMKLVYYLFRDMKNILVEYGSGRLHGVKYLAVIRYNTRFLSSKWRELMNAVKWDVPDKPVFENLEELHVEEVPCVNLCVGELPLGSFCNLKKLIVLDCLNMNNTLLSSNLLKRLQNLEELMCGDMSGIEYVFGTEGMAPEEIIFTKLRKIHLSRLSKLIDICSGPSPPQAIFQNLKSLEVIECHSLKCVFPNPSVVECLVQLEELYVCSCPSMSAVIGASDETDLDMIEFPGLKILFLSDLYRLTRFYGRDKSSSPIINCPKLERRCVLGCGRFEFRALKRSGFRSLKKVHEGHDDYLQLRRRLHNKSSARRTTTWCEEDEQEKLWRIRMGSNDAG